MKKNESINDLIKEMLYWNSRLGLTIFLSLILVMSFWFLFSDQKSGCTIALSVFSQYQNSIAREMELDNVSVAQENFKAFIAQLNKLGVRQKLQLTQIRDINNNKSFTGEEYCSAGIISSKINIPLKFASTLSGSINGTISYLPTLPSVVSIWFMAFLLIFIFRRIEAGIKLKLNREIIDPIKLLSLGISLDEGKALKEVSDINENLKLLKEKIILHEKAQSEIISMQQKSLLSAQVAHDIRSPLAALDMMVSDLLLIPEEKRTIVKSAVTRIKDIANNLMAQNKTNNKLATDVFDNQETHLILPLIEEIMTEKRIQYKNKGEIRLELQIENNAYTAFGYFNESQFKRVLSNLINNSVEACGEQGRIIVYLSIINQQISISIIDNGKGIPSDIIPKLMTKGFSFQKVNGSGLGLYHAKEKVESWGGKITLMSCPGSTNVNLLLPTVRCPDWFSFSIDLRPQMKIVILDDDPSIHHIWEQRFAHHQESIEIIHCYNLEGAYFKMRNIGNNVLFLCDYEISSKNESGLDLIKKLNISQVSILVTSKYAEDSIQKRATKIGTKIIPKNMAGFIKINFDKQVKQKVILIDDDEIIRKTWAFMANRKGIELITFEKINEFENIINQVDRDTWVYIDSDLGEEISGEVYAKNFYDSGFKNIILTTGYDSSQFESLPWITNIVGKSPPW